MAVPDRREDLFAEAVVGLMDDLGIIGLQEAPTWMGDALIAEARRRVDLWCVAESIVAAEAQRGDLPAGA